MTSQWLRLFVILALVGCAGRDKKQAPEPVLTTGNLPGTVVSVNAGARFAVLRFPIGDMPLLNQRMSAYRQGMKVADLKISGPQRETHTVADILAGDCRAGDEVRAD